MSLIKLAIVEDDHLVQDSLNTFFEAQDYVRCLHLSSSVEDFLKTEKASEDHIDVILLDINLLGMSGIEGIPLIMDQCPNTDIVMLTTFEDNESIFKALCAGACSYLSKKTPLKKILEAVEVVYKGGSYMSPSIARKIVNQYAKKRSKLSVLTDRQQDIVKGIVDGKSYKMIADDLFVSIDTVRSHIKNIYKALNINSKAELIRKSYDDDL
ncbi:response regulator transcription factor [Sediminibacter sp. Hel_I_10]|uniref:response regulator n=1 Tax=Sediminibacter sp. Hel_I_10 TaxID=1392490 RepID=UPI00047D58D0|nr:response regulator transcription factor [Sediminibacter sp. Hel_I_10]